MAEDLNLKTVETVDTRPFRKLVMTIGELPTSFIESMTYYELLAWFTNYLETVIIPTVNNNGECVEELQQKYIELKANTEEEIEDFETSMTTLFNELKSFVDNYFDNLDVQEEINNKLDQMAEDGVLQEIITTYIQSNVAWTFDTVAEMKLATNLVDGSYAQTLGYYAIGDNGASYYKIKSATPSSYYETLNSGLYAQLVVEESMNVEQYGAKGDGLTDDQDKINLALSSGASTINFTKGSTYMVRGYNDGDPEGSSLPTLLAQHGLMVQDNTVVNLNYATIKCIANSRTNYNIFSLNNIKNVEIKNGTIIGDIDTHTGATGEWGYGISLKKCENINLHNLHISKCWGDSINLKTYTDAADLNKNITIDNVICEDNRRQGMSIESGDGIIVTNSEFNKTGVTSQTLPSAGVDIEPTEGGEAKNILFYQCKFNENYGCGVEVFPLASNVTLDKCEIVDNQAATSAGVLFANSSSNFTIKNSLVDNTLNSTFKTLPLYLKDTLLLDGNTFKNICVLLRHNTATDKAFYIKNCDFEVNVELAYNSPIEVTNAPSGITANGTQLVVDNCKFVNTSNNANLNIVRWIFTGNAGGYISEAIITNNYLYLGARGIQTPNVNSVIKNNNFVNNYHYPIIINEANYLHLIDGNTFEETGWNTNSVGVINNNAGTNFVLTNNKFFKRNINPEKAITSPAYSPTRFLQQDTPTSSIHESHENYIVDNS